MKSNSILKIIFLTLFILFTALYITVGLGYYEYSNKKTNQLTEEAVKRFEQDLKEGKVVKASDYIKQENDYNNRISKTGINISNFIEKSFDAFMSFIFNEMNKVVSDK